MREELLRMDYITKSYSGINVLKSVSINVFKGECLALIGENGAGKSTIVQMLSGIEHPDSGYIYFDEEEVHINSVVESRQLGIYCVLQIPPIIGSMTVAENMHLQRCGLYKRGMFSIARVNKEARELLKSVNMHLDPEKMGKALTLAEQYMFSLAVALDAKPKLLVLDETTSSFQTKDLQNVKQLIEEFKTPETAVIFVSHDIDTVAEIADRIVVLRDGVNAGNLVKGEFDKQTILKLLLEKQVHELYKRTRVGIGEVLLEARDIDTANGLKSISLAVHEGEILGIVGQVGSGTTMVAQMLFGMEEIRGGHIYVKGRIIPKWSIGKAMQNGIGYIPADRMREGLFGNFNVTDNICSSIIRRLSRAGFIRTKLKRFVARTSMSEWGMPKTIESPIYMMSSGNKQKVVISKWLAVAPKVLIFDEPTINLDIQSKMDVYQKMNEMVKGGTAIILLSSNIQEVLEMSDRIMVMKDNSINSSISWDEADSEILRLREM